MHTNRGTFDDAEEEEEKEVDTDEDGAHVSSNYETEEDRGEHVEEGDEGYTRPPLKTELSGELDGTLSIEAKSSETTRATITSPTSADDVPKDAVEETKDAQEEKEDTQERKVSQEDSLSDEQLLVEEQAALDALFANYS
eukprot:m.137116 g.137116  ORF g.137116 m.137116 type:complete len:140 (+) comp15885_c0_seq1:1015-1434(+)